MTRNIIEKLEIPPENQSSNNDTENKLKNYIEKYLKDKYIGKTFKKYGSINSINLTDIKPYKISRITCFPIYIVSFTAVCTKPEIGQIIEANVNKLTPAFIVLDVGEGIAIVITKDGLEKKGFKYNETGFYQKGKNKNGIRIEYNTKIKIKIINIKYNNRYLCIGELIDVL